MSVIEQKLEEMGHKLPAPKAPLASYLPFKKSGNMLYISGQLPMNEKGLVTGRLGAEVDVEGGQKAAEMCALNILGQIKSAANVPLEDVIQFVKLSIFVASTPDFTDQHLVANGASNLIGELFGEKGRHARAAVGVPSLPLGAAVEIEAIVELAS
ncbi:RidA family protein [Maritalea mediterranea]|uniref:RidA family protein n=1 Tax=Maritalea mediterranea TaxID=2909667 RepID=A0ABS9EAW2_9HYPH|nr:RidA family protein [Maritalea mediterranea]MCF4099898.1 RidA family protein [Maritalea mediterranea]